MYKNIIGIHGTAYSGKDTLSNFICKKNIDTCRYGFADPIKNACNEIFGWDYRHAFGELKEVVDPFFGISPRKAYQLMGTEFGREMIRDDLWLKVAENEMSNNIFSYVIPDFRFKNEYDWLVDKFENNYFMIFITGRKSEIDENDQKHISEFGIYDLYEETNPRHIWVDNSKSLEDLEEISNKISLYFTLPITYNNKVKLLLGK